MVSFTSRERDPNTHWKGGWVGPRASLDVMEKSVAMKMKKGNKMKYTYQKSCAVN
jgi:hypothetical protein